MATEPTYKEKVLALIDEKMTEVVAEEASHQERIEELENHRASIDHKKDMLESLRASIEEIPMKKRNGSASTQDQDGDED